MAPSATTKKTTTATTKKTTTKKKTCECKYSASDIQKIKEQAYYLWVNSGMPENADMDNWLKAEAEFKKSCKTKN
ncbi:MAG: DUF2934 domain-containing protein [Candidatus Auribacterota bacterium]|jgi:hypothetical protein|nr:DUF2934 domain-containing protein [Candidatus Auribacterota bacterium]